MQKATAWWQSTPFLGTPALRRAVQWNGGTGVHALPFRKMAVIFRNLAL